MRKLWITTLRRATDPVVFTKDGTRFLRMGDCLRKVPPLYLDVEAKLILDGLRSLKLSQADESRILQGNARLLFHLPKGR